MNIDTKIKNKNCSHQKSSHNKVDYDHFHPFFSKIVLNLRKKAVLSHLSKQNNHPQVTTYMFFIMRFTGGCESFEGFLRLTP